MQHDDLETKCGSLGFRMNDCGEGEMLPVPAEVLLQTIVTCQGRSAPPLPGLQRAIGERALVLRIQWQV